MDALLEGVRAEAIASLQLPSHMSRQGVLLSWLVCESLSSQLSLDSWYH